MINKLVFFDFDYTLARTYECVRLWSPRGTKTIGTEKYIPLSPQQYNTIKIADDELINEESFIEFRKVNIANAKPILPVLLLMNYLHVDNNVVKVLSARPQEAEPFVKKFLEKSQVKNYRDITFKGCGSSLPLYKFNYISECIEKYNPNEVYLFDDSYKVVKYIEDNHYLHHDAKLITCLVESNRKEEVLKFRRNINKKKFYPAVF